MAGYASYCSKLCWLQNQIDRINDQWCENQNNSESQSVLDVFFHYSHLLRLLYSVMLKPPLFKTLPSMAHFRWKHINITKYISTYVELTKNHVLSSYTPPKNTHLVGSAFLLFNGMGQRRFELRSTAILLFASTLCCPKAARIDQATLLPQIF